MKLEKKHYTMIVVGAVVLFLIYWFLLRKKKPESSYDPNVMIFGDSNYTDAEINPGIESGYSKTKGGLKPNTGNSTMRPISEKIRRKIAENGSITPPGPTELASCSAPGAYSDHPGCRFCAWGPVRWWEGCTNPNQNDWYMKWT